MSHGTQNLSMETTSPESSAQRHAVPLALVRGSAFDAARYSWDAVNLRGFATWADEIAHAESLGYQLVPPDYHLPHWSASLNGDAAKIYTMGGRELREVNTSFDRPAAQIGYPLYFGPNTDSQTPGRISK